MKDWIVPLSAVRRADVAQVGGKAAALGELLAAGFPVPLGLCVTTAVFHQVMAPYKDEINRLCQQIDVFEPQTAVDASAKIFTLLQNITLPEAVGAELHSFLESGDWRVETNPPPSALFAVRSSATVEDQEEVSYAGQYATLLGIRGQQAIEEAVLVCWCSFFTPQALMARAYQGALGPDEGMAVLIQPLIVADCAGVCFTVDPIQERDDVMVINAAWGLGEGVVDGSVPADSHWVRRRDLSIEWQRIVEKGEMVGVERGGWGLETNDQSPVCRLLVSSERSRAACLPEAWVRRVAEFGLAVEQVWGRPQDIEWAIADGRFWLLQSRPITGLPEEMMAAPHFPVEWPDEVDGRHAWRLTEHCEGPEPPLPLEHDFIGLRESIREETCRYLGADRHEEWWIWNGRAYWRHIPLGMSPADRQVRQQVFADLHDRLQALGWSSWDYWRPEMEQMVERLRAFDRETADGSALADHLAQAQAVVRYCMAIHPRVLFRPRDSYFAAFSAVSGLEGKEAERRLTTYSIMKRVS
jgi:pyruvate,water dikinase